MVKVNSENKIPKRERNETLLDLNTCGWLILTHLKKMIKTNKEIEAYTYDDLYKMPKRFMYSDYKNFENFYEKRLKIKGDKLDMFGTILSYHRVEFIKALITTFIYYGIEIAFALVLKQLLTWLSKENAEEKEGWILTAILCCLVFIRSIASLWNMYHRELCTVILKNCTRALIINKVRSIAPGAKKYVDISKVTNYLMVDTAKMSRYCMMRPNLYVVPVVVLFLMLIIYNEVGWLGFAVIIILILAILLQKEVQKKFVKVNLKRMGLSDKRGKKISEIIKGIKIVKFSAWEKLMNKIVTEYRKKEGKLIFLTFLYSGISRSISFFVPTLITVVIFSLYEVVYDEKLTIAQIYTMMTIFSTLLMPINFYIMGLLQYVDAKAAASRIKHLVQVEPIEPLKDDPSLNKGEIEIIDGDFNWEDPKYYKLFEGKEMKNEDQTLKILEGINLKVKSGEFLAVIGNVGSGKSSLVLAMMNEIVKKKGEVKKNGKIAYISQEAFLLNETVRENIVFGNEYNKEKYEKILEICQLKPDLLTLKAGDMTEIGERGINLSGGQKQRISIARAVYSDSDIYLIDDSLSALDAYVGKKIMNDVFKGYLKDKTRIMVTHYLHLLNQVDRVLMVKAGKIVALGTLEEVKKNEEYKNFSNKQNKDDKEDEEEESNFEDIVDDEGDFSINKVKKPRKLPPVNHHHGNKVQTVDEEKSLKTENKINLTTKKNETEENKQEKNDNERKDKGRLTKQEKKNKGVVGAKIYWYYMRSAGFCLSFFTILIYIVAFSIKIFTDWWVGQMNKDSFNKSKEYYLYIYIGAACILVIFYSVNSANLGFISRNSAMNIFRSILWNVLRRPMRFFDTTPQGVVLNRMVSDVDAVDFTTPTILGFFLDMMTAFTGTLIFTMIFSPVIILVVIIAVLFVLSSFKNFVRTTTDYKRLTQLSGAPMISIAGEFIEGVTTIRNYGKEKHMIDTYIKRADIHHNADVHEQLAGLWMRSKMEIAVSFMISISIVSIVFNKKNR